MTTPRKKTPNGCPGSLTGRLMRLSLYLPPKWGLTTTLLGKARALCADRLITICREVRMKAVHKMGVVNEPSSRGYNPRPAREAYVFKTVDTAAKALACNLYVRRERMHSPLGRRYDRFLQIRMWDSWQHGASCWKPHRRNAVPPRS